MRLDLLALTPEALAVLANMGLVKRAQKDIAAGLGPTLSEDANSGTVRGTFPDGICSTLPPGKSLTDGHCTCGASSVCRHRVATVLAYVAQAGQGHPTEINLISRPDPATGTSKSEDGAPGSVPGPSDEDELKTFLGRRIYDKALKLRGRTQARVESETMVHLDTCSVRFLSGHRLEFARCDCRAAGPCEHLALALWAIRGTLTTAPAAPVSLGPLDEALALVQELLGHGVSHLGQGLGSRFEETRRQLLGAGMVWPYELVEEIAEELAYYRGRSGRYRASRLAWCACSLWTRRQVVAHRPELAMAALGLNQSPETSLRQLRLTGLGCQLEKDETSYFLADSSTGKVLVLRHRTGQGPSGLSPVGLAGGQLVTAGAHRRANGLVRLGRGPHSLSSCSSWDHLSKLHGPPPAQDELIGECHASPAIRILPIQALIGGYYSPGQQELSLLVESAECLTRVALFHRAAAPFALECLWEVRHSLRAVAGVMEREGYGWLMRPTALLAEHGVLVPDLASEGSLEQAPLGQPCEVDEPLARALRSALACWHEIVHRGLSASPERARESAGALRKTGLSRTASQLEEARSAEDWLRLAARLEIALQILHPGATP